MDLSHSFAHGGGHLKIISCRNLMFVKTDVLLRQQTSQKKAQKGPEPPTPMFLTKSKPEGVDLRRNMQGLRNSHLLYGPSW